MIMVNTTYNTTEKKINNIKEIKGQTNIKIFKKISNYYTEMKHKNFQTQEDPSSKTARGISEIYHELLLLSKFLETKSQVKNMNINLF